MGALWSVGSCGRFEEELHAETVPDFLEVLIVLDLSVPDFRSDRVSWIPSVQNGPCRPPPERDRIPVFTGELSQNTLGISPRSHRADADGIPGPPSARLPPHRRLPKRAVAGGGFGWRFIQVIPESVQSMKHLCPFGVGGFNEAEWQTCCHRWEGSSLSS